MTQNNYAPQVGDKVYHRLLQETGTVTATGIEYSGDTTSTVVMFGHEEKEVSTSLLKKVED